MEEYTDRDDLSVQEILKAGTAVAILAGLREGQGDVDKQMGRSARRAAIRCYQIAQIALTNDDLWLDICTDPIWNEMGFKRPPKEGDRANVLRFAIRLSVGFDGPQHDDIVSRRFRGMKEAFNRNDSVPELTNLLDEHGGVEGLGKWEKQQKRAQLTETDEGSVETVTLRLSGPAVSKLKQKSFRDFRIQLANKSKRGKTITASVHTLHGLMVIERPKKPS